MRVLQVHNRYREAGGEDDVVVAEAAVLRGRGHEVHDLQVDNPGRPVAAAIALLRSPWNTSSARAVRGIARQFRPDVAHVHNTWFQLTPSVLSALHELDVPTVLTLHNYRLTCANAQLLRDGSPCELCVGAHPWHGVRYACYRGSRLASIPAAATIAVHDRRRTWMEAVDAHIALTTFARELFIRAGLPADRVHIKPHFTPDPGVRTRPPSASADILYVGRMSPEKGVHRLVNAFQRVDDQSLRLVIIGDGPERPVLESMAGPRIEFTGWLERTDVQRRMLSARALAFPSVWYETFGLSMIEAMAAGLPVVATDLGGTAGIVGHCAGVLVPEDQDGAWERALTSLAEDAFVDSAGVCARQRWSERFSPEHAVERLEVIYAAARGRTTAAA